MSIDLRIATAIREADARGAIDGGFRVSQLPAGTLLSVVTENNVYHVVVVNPDKGDLAVEGGVLAEPHLFQLIGSTFGGSIIKPDWIGAGMVMKCYNFHTSTVQSVKVEDNPELAKRITEEAKKNTVEITVEQAEEGLQKFLEGELIDPLVLQEVRSYIDGFSLSGRIALATFFVKAKEKNRLEKAFDAAKEMWEEAWGFQHPQMRGDPELGNNAHYLKELYARTGISLKS